MNYLSAFEKHGYSRCDDWQLEPGHRKAVVYAKDGSFTHTARQLPNGNWTSKMGSSVDIEHDTPAALSGGRYGEIFAVFRKKA